MTTDTQTRKSETPATSQYKPVDGLLLEVAGAGKAIVGGLSLGGYMSLAFYRSHPERTSALLIIDTGPGFKKDDAREVWNKRALDTADRFERGELFVEPSVV